MHDHDPTPSPASPAAVAAPGAQVDDLLEDLLDAAKVARHRPLVRHLMAEALQLGAAGPDELDLKIATAALGEMGDAFAMFAPYRGLRKVTVFGSARIRSDDPLYDQGRRVAGLIAEEGWHVITGAGPGLMTAAIEGAGRANSFGVHIRLPFETQVQSVLLDEGRSVGMKYFFTRKLMLIKESHGFVCLPGGFGTLDEMFELLTLTQTGKGVPVPIVLLDPPGDPYWEGITGWLNDQLVRRGFVGADDERLYLVTESAEEAVAELCGFYANYDSVRWVGDRLVVRVRRAPSAEQLGALNDEFADLCLAGVIEAAGPTRAEVADGDRLDLARIALRLDPRRQGGLRMLIDALNRLAAPPDADPAP